MPIFALIGGIGSAIIGGMASNNAAKSQQDAVKQADATQTAMFNQVQAEEQPFIQAGTNALTAIQEGLGIGPGGGGMGTGALNKPFSLSDFTKSPGYEFQMQQGEEAIINERSAVGGIGGGNTLKALTSYGQGLANQDYWNAYNAYVGRQNQQFNQLESLASGGQNAAANLGHESGQVASSIGQNIIGGGNAAAAGQIGVANALAGGLNSTMSNYILSNYLSSSGGGGVAGNALQPVDPGLA